MYNSDSEGNYFDRHRRENVTVVYGYDSRITNILNIYLLPNDRRQIGYALNVFEKDLEQ